MSEVSFLTLTGHDGYYHDHNRHDDNHDVSKTE